MQVHLEKSGFTMHVFIDPVTRAEFSAREIRSRITASVNRSHQHEATRIGSEKLIRHVKQQLNETNDSVVTENMPGNIIASGNEPAVEKTESVNKQLPQTSFFDGPGSNFKTDEQSEAKDICVPEGATNSRPFSKTRHSFSPSLVGSFLVNLDLSVFVQHSCIIFIDDVSFSSYSREVIRVSFDNVLIVYSPGTEKQRSLNNKITKQEHNFLVCVGCLQIDNQMFRQGSYDFGVVMMPQDSAQFRAVVLEDGVTPAHRLAIMRKNSMIVLDSVLHVRKKYELLSVRIEMKPVSLFLEDSFIFDIMQLVDSFVPTQLSHMSTEFISWQQLPSLVQYTSSSLRHPVRLQNLSVAALSMLISVHASLKLFIASDSTPLSVGAFDKSDICTTSWKLARALIMHYMAGAILRAGTL